MNYTELVYEIQSYAENEFATDDIDTFIKGAEQRIYNSVQLPAIRKAVQRASEHHARLNEALTARPDLFKRPRTTIFHGVVVGYKKGKPSYTYDADFVIQQIKLRLPLKKDSLIRVEEKVVAEGIKLLSEDERKKIGVQFNEGKDAVVITPTDSAIDKAVNALLAAAIDEKTTQEGEE